MGLGGGDDAGGGAGLEVEEVAGGGGDQGVGGGYVATLAPDPHQRSELVEAALRDYLRQLGKCDPSGDLEIINVHMAELNQEAEDVLSYQVMPRGHTPRLRT